MCKPILWEESLISHKDLQGFWQKIGADFIHLDKVYLVMANYFLKYPFKLQIYSVNTTTVIGHLIELFSLEGIPTKSSKQCLAFQLQRIIAVHR